VASSASCTAWSRSSKRIIQGMAATPTLSDVPGCSSPCALWQVPSILDARVQASSCSLSAVPVCSEGPFQGTRHCLYVRQLHAHLLW
jgi:hypothetical protein